MRLVSWNVNGIRAIIKKEFLASVKAMDVDVLCLQETKAAADEAADALTAMEGYHVYVNSSDARKGYSGTAIISKEEPLNVTYDIGLEEHDREGRVITAEFMTFFLVTVYTPNSGDMLARLDYRQQWMLSLIRISTTAKKKTSNRCGDFNVAHAEIDIARAKENYNKSAGYTQREIDGFTRLLDTGFTDTFRYLHPTEVKYTYWNYVTSGRKKI